MSRRNRTLIVITTIIAMSGVFSVHRVVADSAGTSATQADGSPTQIAALARYLDAGELHTCVVLDGGELKCFGANTSGQIGSGGTVALGDAAGEMGDALIAVQLGTGRTVRAVSTGMLHTCALLARSVPGVRTVVGVAVSGKVQVAERVSPPAEAAIRAASEMAEAISQQALPALVASRDLSRRVLVVAQPG